MTQKTPKSRPAAPDATVGALIGEFMVEKQREREDEARRALRPRSRRLLVVVLGVLCAAAVALTVILERPEPPLPADRFEAGARMTLFLASERIREYQRRTGTLPERLLDARVDTTGLSYWRSTDSVFEIWTEVAGSRLRYRSTMPNGEFLGAALRILGSAP